MRCETAHEVQYCESVRVQIAPVQDGCIVKPSDVGELLHGESASIKTMGEGVGDLDLDALMAELSDDEVVRVKEIEFAPMTEEEALVQIDLLGHDFFVYTDRDTDTVRVLYRRSEGGYGLLKQPENA